VSVDLVARPCDSGTTAKPEQFPASAYVGSSKNLKDLKPIEANLLRMQRTTGVASAEDWLRKIDGCNARQAKLAKPIFCGYNNPPSYPFRILSERGGGQP